jgi:hypothetical protein
MTTRVLIVERPGPFRDALLNEMSERGLEAHVRDDAMDALASLERVTPHVVLVSDDPGPPGALGLCRVLQRKLNRAQVYRLGEPSVGDQLEERSMLLPRSVGAVAVAAAIFDRADNANDNARPIAPREYEGAVGSLELGPLLLAIEARWLTGRLTITRPGTEREFAFVRGQPIFARSTLISERIGSLAVRHGMLSEQQVEHAVDVARARGVRLGVAMLDLNMLDAVGLMSLLSMQLLELLTAACNSGAVHARFVNDRSVHMRYPLQRMCSMTALLHAVAVMSETDIAAVLEELGPQPLEILPQPPVERFLADMQLAQAVPLTGHSIDRVATLRRRLQEATPAEITDRAEHPDVIALALLRSGSFRMRPAPEAAHAELPASVRTLSPPSLVNAALRCAQSDFSRWPLSPIARARTPLEQAVDISLHGKRSPEQARALALHGPAADCEPRYREVYGLLLRDPEVMSAEPSATAMPELRMRCHAQLKQVDALEAENLGGLCRAHLLQTRVRIERALALLPSGDANAPRAPVAPMVGYLTQTIPPVAQAQIAAATAPEVALASAAEAPDDAAEVAPVTAAESPRAEVAEAVPEPAFTPPKPMLSDSERALLKAAEPLLEQARWHDLRTLLAADNSSAANLPPLLALLYAVAVKEEQALRLSNRPSKHDPFTSSAGAAEALAISVVQKLFELPEPSVISVMLAKRLLRKRPLDWKQKPPPRVSVMLVGSALLLGALVGFLLHPSLLGLFWK